MVWVREIPWYPVLPMQSPNSTRKATSCLKWQFPVHTLLWNFPVHKCALWQAWKKDSRSRPSSSSVRFNLNLLSYSCRFVLTGGFCYISQLQKPEHKKTTSRKNGWWSCLFAVEQTNELLLHFATAVRTNSFAGSHNSPST